MLFESIDKLKRTSIMSSILLVFLGAVVIICPENLLPSLMLGFGYALVILAVIMVLNFISSKKCLMDYLKFGGSLIIGFVGACTLVFRDDTLRVITWLVAFILVVDGLRSVYNSLTYARQSQRKGWWILTILGVLLIASGIVLFINPWWKSPVFLAKIFGFVLMFSAIIDAIRLYWIWPIKKKKEGETDG